MNIDWNEIAHDAEGLPGALLSELLTNKDAIREMVIVFCLNNEEQSIYCWPTTGLRLAEALGLLEIGKAELIGHYGLRPVDGEIS